MNQIEKVKSIFKPKIKVQNYFDSKINEVSHKSLLISNYKGFKITIDEFPSVLSVGVKVESDIAFSINKPNGLFRITKPLKHYSPIVYVSDYSSTPFDNLIHETFWVSFLKWCSSLNLEPHEGVYIYKNLVNIVLDPRRDIITIIDEIVGRVEKSNSVFRVKSQSITSAAGLPDHLKSLFPLAKKWGIPDDSDRQLLIERMNNKQKELLIKKVSPLLVAIDDYLDTFADNALSDAAGLLGNLAELVSELKTSSSSFAVSARLNAYCVDGFCKLTSLLPIVVFVLLLLNANWVFAQADADTQAIQAYDYGARCENDNALVN